MQAIDERDHQEVADHRQGEAAYNIKVNSIKKIGDKCVFIDTDADRFYDYGNVVSRGAGGEPHS